LSTVNITQETDNTKINVTALTSNCRTCSRASAEKFKKRPQNSTIKPLPGGQRKKDQKIAKNTEK